MAFIGIDVGTSSVKGVLVGDDGAVLHIASNKYDFDMPKPGWTETPAARWWTHTVTVLRELSAKGHDIVGVGLTGQMHGSVLLDSDSLGRGGRDEIDSIRPALMWNDQRTVEQCVQITEAFGGAHGCVEQLGSAALPGLTLPKLLWVKQNEPERWARVCAVCLPKDFVALQLTGVLAGDVGDLSGTLMLSPATRRWNRTSLDLLGIDDSVLPAVHESSDVVGRVTAWSAAQTGLAEGTPVVVGSGDNQAAAIGAGVTEPGQLMIVLGTSGVVLAPSVEPKPDLEGPGRLHLFCDATGSAGSPGGYVLTGCMLSAAGSLEWARSVLAAGERFDVMMDEASAVGAGSDGLMFLPHLTGERCPYADPTARGGWISATRAHTRGHLVRAVVEGVCIGLAQIKDMIGDLAGEPHEVRLTGGAAKSALWRQILADCLGLPVAPVAVDEGPAYGAAILGAVGVGRAGSVSELSSAWVSMGEETTPGMDRGVYGALGERYRDAYGSLRPIWEHIEKDRI